MVRRTVARPSARMAGWLAATAAILACALAHGAPPTTKTSTSSSRLGSTLLVSPPGADGDGWATLSQSAVHTDASHRLLPRTTLALALPAGRSFVRVELPAGRFVTIGVLGPPNALLCFDVLPAGLGAQLRAHSPLEHDGRLPVFLSFRTLHDGQDIVVVVDVEAPVLLARVAADPEQIEAPSFKQLRSGEALPRLLIGLPFPIEPRDGYVLQAPHRYQFMRVDAAVALRAALRQTLIRFKRDPIAIGEITQWDGRRPAADLGDVRHISHDEGRDVDVGLPADDDEPSTFRRHCRGVLVEKDKFGCAPGTARGLDALRLTYLLGLLLDGPTPNGRYMPENRPGPMAVVETIYTDQEYVNEIRKAAEKLRRRRWIHDDGYTGLGEDGVLRASPWHLDHVHIRFAGEPARPIRWH